MIEPTYDNAGNIILVKVGGTPYTEAALLEKLELASWAERRKEVHRRADRAYEQRNAERRKARKRVKA